MSVGGVNQIENEPKRRASKKEVDDVEAEGGGHEYTGQEPIVVNNTNDTVRILMDDTPVQGSVNMVTSDGIKTQIDAAKVTVDTAMSDTSVNPVQNRIVKAYVDASKVTVDTAMSDTSVNPVQNRIVKAYVDSMTPAGEVDDEMSSTSENAVQNKIIKQYVDGRAILKDAGSTVTQEMEGSLIIDEALQVGFNSGLLIVNSDVGASVGDTPTGETGIKIVNENRLMNEVNQLSSSITQLSNVVATKQDLLTFDDLATEGSSNPVKSGGIYGQMSLIQDGVNTNSSQIAELSATKQDTISVSSPVTKSGNTIGLSTTDSITSGLPITGTGVADYISALENSISAVDEKRKGMYIVGCWHGSVSVSGCTRTSGNLTVQAYGTSNPGLYLCSGFTQSYNYRFVMIQQYHTGVPVIVRPATNTSNTQFQFTVNNCDDTGTAYSDTVTIDIIVMGYSA